MPENRKLQYALKCSVEIKSCMHAFQARGSKPEFLLGTYLSGQMVADIATLDSAELLY